MTDQPTKRGGYKHDGEAKTVTAYVEIAVWEQLTAYAKAQGRTTSELLNEIIKSALGIPTRFGVKWEDAK